ncbi:hypothetical protein LXA43DRAFT_84210 [Ganoderma leucocontextum]|nr:hypothetical protein LXA43DRAFT_84210 [Ganoderma leucocontextum]
MPRSAMHREGSERHGRHRNLEIANERSPGMSTALSEAAHRPSPTLWHSSQAASHPSHRSQYLLSQPASLPAFAHVRTPHASLLHPALRKSPGAPTWSDALLTRPTRLSCCPLRTGPRVRPIYLTCSLWESPPSLCPARRTQTRRISWISPRHGHPALPAAELGHASRMLAFASSDFYMWSDTEVNHNHRYALCTGWTDSC